MLRWISIIVLTVAVIGVAIWGYQEHQEKNAILLQAENNYQRSFHDLTYYVDLLNDKIGTVLAMNSPTSLSPELAEIWRITSEAHSEVGQLPLALLPFNKTEEFLSNIGDFSYRVAVRGLDKDPLTDDEVKLLNTLYQQSGEIKRELRNVQHLALDNNLRWMDVQLALVNNEGGDNTIIDGFKTVEKNAESFSESTFATQLNGVTKHETEKINLEGDNINENDVREIANTVFNVDGAKLKVTPTGDGADIKMFSASYNQGDEHGYFDITQKGGYIISMIISRDMKEPTIGLYEGSQKAANFLKKAGFDDVEMYNSVQYNNVGVYSFAGVQDNVRIYPDNIQVKVALDNGQVVGLTTKDYLVNHQERQIKEPKLTEAEARKEVNPRVDIQENGLAIIDSDLGEEVLCYEFIGIFNDETYRIYINAQDGFEERVEKLEQTEMNFDTAA